MTNNQLMYSNAGAIKELGAMTDGQIVVGKNASAPQIVSMSGDVSINNTGATTVGKIGGTTVSGVGLAYNNVLQNTSGGAIAGNSMLVSNGTGTGVTALSTPATGVLTSSGSVPTWSSISSDTFTQYALLAGRAGGQTLNGGTSPNNDLTLDSTSNATKGNIIMAPNGGNVGIGTTALSPAKVNIEGPNTDSALQVTGGAQINRGVIEVFNNKTTLDPGGGWLLRTRSPQYYVSVINEFANDSGIYQNQDGSVLFAARRSNGVVGLNLESAPNKGSWISGRLGIGTTGPSLSPLEVNGGLRPDAGDAYDIKIAGQSSSAFGKGGNIILQPGTGANGGSNTNGRVQFNGHISSDPTIGSEPVITTLPDCSGGTVITGSTDTRGSVSFTATPPPTCKITFKNPYATTPTCLASFAGNPSLSGGGSISLFISSPSTTDFTFKFVTLGTVTGLSSGIKYNFICME